jgi:hypothetical protein
MLREVFDRWVATLNLCESPASHILDHFKKHRNRDGNTGGQPIMLRASGDNNEALVVQTSHEKIHK